MGKLLQRIGCIGWVDGLQGLCERQRVIVGQTRLKSFENLFLGLGRLIAFFWQIGHGPASRASYTPAPY